MENPVNHHKGRRGLIIFLVLSLFVTVACDLPEILDFVLGRDSKTSPTAVTQANGVLSYYGTGNTDDTMKYSSGPITCHNETGYATLKIFAANAIPSINTHFSRDLAADESFFIASMYDPYKAVGPNNRCDYFPEGSYPTVSVYGFFNTKTSVFTPDYTDSEYCPDATVLKADGQTMIIDFHCLRTKVWDQSYHFELSLQGNTTK
jgi:hypothetical protein